MTSATVNTSDALLGVYRQAGPVFVRGEGSYLIAENGARYLDFASGIAVNALGYGDPDFRAAVIAALDDGLVHVSNLFRSRPAGELAQWLVEHSFADRVFFCNSGAEANEGAFKFARRWAGGLGKESKNEIVAFRGSFHGRTMGALAATDRPSFQEPFRPLMPGVRFCELGDEEELRNAISADRTAAVIIEPIQGEGGVRPIPSEFLRTLRELCDEANALLIFDEIQVGLGRTGTFWAHEPAEVTPDLLTVAKPLAGGLPMAAILLTERVASAVQPGDHATTFGGGPLVASAALAVCRKIGDPAFLAEVQRKGDLIAERLGGIGMRGENVVAIRGVGMIWGIEIDGAASEVVSRAMEAGLIIITAGPNVIRLLPPLTVSEEELAEGLSILEKVI